ncbi:class I SAM-dependent methyltransferase [Candidatus Uhrbacteria bacterium]|nr:class I SAM-dependent methyltransferase [Candidatus Uhrbacteria bacterium]
MTEWLSTQCPICGAPHTEADHLQNLPIERKEGKGIFSVQDALLAITGNPIRLETERDVFNDEDTQPRAFLTTRGIFYLDHKNRTWLTSNGERSPDPHAIESYLHFERAVNAILKKYLPQSYDLLEIRNWHYRRGDPPMPSDPRLATIYQELLDRLRQLPLKQLAELAPWDMTQERSRAVLLPAIEEQLADRVSTISAGHKHRGSQVHLIASFFEGRLLAEDGLETNIKKALRGKRILVLGDDIGTLSEVLRIFGARAYGIEYDRKAAAFARSGLFAENLKPQRQLIEGDIRRLMNQASPLFEEIKKIGPFDMIYSRTVLPYIGLHGLPGWHRLFAQLDTLTKPQGLNIHGDCPGDITTSDRAKTLLYEIQNNSHDSRQSWAHEQYKEMSQKYAATSSMFVMRHGSEAIAHTVLQRLGVTLEE